MRRTLRNGFIVFVGVAAIVYWILTQVGIVLAISPALSGVEALVSIVVDPFVSLLSNPYILVAVLLIVAGAGIVVWYRVDDVGAALLEGFAWCKERLGFTSPVVVRGSIEHGGVRWIGNHTRDGGTRIEHRACLHCAMELEEDRIPDTELDRPNSPITADEETRERETRVRENVFGREKADSEEYVEALVCPSDGCDFSIRGEKYIMRGKSAVRKQFREHFRRMRAGGSDPFGKWHQHADKYLDFDLEPKPADLWDAYARECDDETVLANQSFGQGFSGKNKSVTCAALEAHKENAEGVNQLIELAPDTFDRILAWLFRSKYLEKRREITRKMNEEEEKCRSELQYLETQYGSIVEQILDDRYDRRDPQIDLESTEHQLNTAKAVIDELRDDLEFDYLSSKKQRWLSANKNGVADAVEYVAQLRAFKAYRREITPSIGAFEERFEPYTEGENYMTTPDETFLKETCSEIRQQLTDLYREVRLELLPLEMTEWAETKNDTFTERSRLLLTYNELFVERECERYEELFQTEHGPLNEEQQKAIVRNDVHNLVDASAGTGKTLTLTYRFQYLYERGVPLDDIVAITFSNDAADEMESRIAETLDVSPARLNVSTCHSLANDIVGDSMLGSIDNDRDMDAVRERYVEGFLGGDDELRERHGEEMTKFEEEHENFLRSEKDYVNNHNYGDTTRQEFIRNKYEDFIENARDFDQTPEEIRSDLTKANRTQYHFGRAACAILSAFLDHGRSTKEPVDYDDMVKSAIRLGQEAPTYFSGQYRHILFDEFQDVSESDLEFIDMFLQGSEDTRLFAVGDDWQSIYGFRGSDPQYFIEFDDRFDGTTHTQLAINYRCPPAVVEAGVELMKNSEEQQNEKTVEAFSDLSETPVIHKLGGISESRVAKRTADVTDNVLRDNDIEPTDVMILSRTKDSLEDIGSSLDECGIHRTSINKSDTDGVKIQTIHNSKGTEAECVILVNATDGTPHGLPSSEKKNELLDPAIDNTADYYAEERRLCYVALTRAERHLHIVTEIGKESRYLKDIAEFFEERRSNVWSATGVLGPWDYPDTDSNEPFEAQLACDGYTTKLKTWDTTFPQKLESGQRYRLSNIDPKNDGYGEEIKLDESVKIEKLDSEGGSTAES